MKKIRVAINGFGRVGRQFYRIAEDYPEIDVVAINHPRDINILAHLFKYDSVHGIYKGTVEFEEGKFIINGKEVKHFKEQDPASLPWKELEIDVVIESTGKFRDRDTAGKHITAGAKKVIITAPAKKEDITIVLGVNEENYDPANHHIISNASCTTNCLAPVVKVLHDNFTIVKGLMTTVHSYTNDQRILDKPHKDLRRARAGAVSIIPTSTGAAKAVGVVMPELKGKMNGIALRVPTPNVSVVDLVCEVSRPVTVEEVNGALKAAAEGKLKGILGFSEEPLVSVDFNGNSLSSIVDAELTMVSEGNMVKVFAWYDNEWGYTTRVVDLVKFIGEKGIN